MFTTGARAIFTCGELSPLISSICFREITTFSLICSSWLSNLSFCNSLVSPCFSPAIGLLSLPPHYYNLHPQFILLCSLIQGTAGWLLRNQYHHVKIHFYLMPIPSPVFNSSPKQPKAWRSITCLWPITMASLPEWSQAKGHDSGHFPSQMRRLGRVSLPMDLASSVSIAPSAGPRVSFLQSMLGSIIYWPCHSHKSLIFFICLWKGENNVAYFTELLWDKGVNPYDDFIRQSLSKC